MLNFEFLYVESRAPEVLTIDGIWTNTTCLLFSTKRDLALEWTNSLLISSIGISSQNTWGKGPEHPSLHSSLYSLKRQVFPNSTFAKDKFRTKKKTAPPKRGHLLSLNSQSWGAG